MEQNPDTNPILHIRPLSEYSDFLLLLARDVTMTTTPKWKGAVTGNENCISVWLLSVNAEIWYGSEKKIGYRKEIRFGVLGWMCKHSHITSEEALCCISAVIFVTSDCSTPHNTTSQLLIKTLNIRIRCGRTGLEQKPAQPCGDPWFIFTKVPMSDECMFGCKLCLCDNSLLFTCI